MNTLNPYREPGLVAAAPEHSPSDRWLYVQVALHVLILLTYGTLTCIGIAYATAGAGGGELAGLAIALCGVTLLVSAGAALKRSVQRLKRRPFGIRTPDPTFEVVHYTFGLLMCVTLTILSLWFLPALLFCLYSLYVLHAYSTRGLSKVRATNLERAP